MVERAVPRGVGGEHLAEVVVADDGDVESLTVEVVIPRQKEHAPVAALVELEVVPCAAAAGVVVADAGEAERGERAQPLVHIHGVGQVRCVGRAGLIEDVPQVHDARVVVVVAVVADEEIPAAAFLHGAGGGDVDGVDVVGLGNFETLRRAAFRGRRVVDEFVFEGGEVRAVGPLAIEIAVVELRHRERAAAGVAAARGDEIDHVIVHRRNAAGAIEEVPVPLLALAVAAAGRAAAVAAAVEVHGEHFAAERLHGIELRDEAEAHIGEASALAALQPEARVVEDFALFINDRRRQRVVAHYVGGEVQEVCVRLRHQHTNAMPWPGRDGAVIPANERAVRGIARDCAGRVRGFDVELDERAGELPGQRGFVESAASRHGESGECGRHRLRAVAVFNNHAARAVGVGNADAQRAALICRRHHRRLREAGDRRAEVRHGAAVRCAGRAGVFGNRQQPGAAEAIEVEPRIEPRAAADPAGAEAEAVVDPGVERVECRAVLERGLAMVVHVLRRTRGNDAQHFVAGAGGIVLHDAACVAAVIAEQAPGAGIAGSERTILNPLRAAAGDAHVIHEHLAGVEQAENELVVLRRIVRARVGRAESAPGERLPRALGGFIARGPAFRRAVVGICIAQFQTAAAAVRRRGPATAGLVMHGVGGVVVRVFEHHRVALVGKRAAPRSVNDSRQRRILRREHHMVFGDHEIAARTDALRREIEAHPAAQFPSCKAHRAAAAIIKLHPFLRIIRRARLQRHWMVMIHDFIDDHGIRHAERGLRAGIVSRRRHPRAGRRARLRFVLHHHAVEHTARADEEELVAIERTESERRLIEREPRAGGECAAQCEHLTG